VNLPDCKARRGEERVQKKYEIKRRGINWNYARAGRSRIFGPSKVIIKFREGL